MNYSKGINKQENNMNYTHDTLKEAIEEEISMRQGTFDSAKGWVDHLTEEVQAFYSMGLEAPAHVIDEKLKAEAKLHNEGVGLEKAQEALKAELARIEQEFAVPREEGFLIDDTPYI